MFVLLMMLCPAVALLAPGDARVAQANAERLLGVERFLGIHNEATFVDVLDRWPMLGTAAVDIFYLVAHLSAVIGVLVWLYVRRPRSFPPIRNLFVVAQLLTVAGYLLFPTAPPHLLGKGVALPVTGPTTLLQYEYAAFPSGHVAFALVAAIGLWTGSGRPGVRVAAVCYPLLMTLIVIATNNHYWLDAMAAVVVVSTSHVIAMSPSLRGLYRRQLRSESPSIAGWR